MKDTIDRNNVFDLRKQVEKRREGSQQIAETVRKINEKNKKMETMRKEEWDNLKTKLDAFERKCIIHIINFRVVEQADNRAKIKNCEKIICATRSSTNGNLLK